MTTRSSHQLVDHLFRHQAGRMIAVLARIFGTDNLGLAEDVVQDAFLKAIQSWGMHSIPDNPGAWLMRVARNQALDIIRRRQCFAHISRELAAQLDQVTEQHIEQLFLDDEIRDSQLRMIFACCHPSLNEEDQIAITLKAVSGFSAAEIARALVMQEAAIQKRLYRARKALQENQVQLEMPNGAALTGRLETVLLVIYLLFNEGYNSQKADELIRKDLCVEAMRLCLLLTEQPALQQPSVYALMALMCFQASRFESRMGEDDTIILLGHQNRGLWSKELIGRGFIYLNHSSKGETLSVYHIESAIAAEHCMAASFSSTNWARMLKLYDLLAEHKPGPITTLNRAVVKMQLGLHGQAIEDILAIPDIEMLLQLHYMYSAVLGDIYQCAGEHQMARKYIAQAMELTNSVAEKKLMAQKLEAL